ncbi:MAG: Bor/Iss family lipoprotein [Bacteroidales bacterium]
MNKKLLIAVLVLCSLTMTSCFNTKIINGSVAAKDPVAQVNQTWNHYLLWGLVPLKKTTLKASDYVGQRENYVVSTKQTFVNGFVYFLTFGLYSPFTTTYYVPLDDVNSVNK